MSFFKFDDKKAQNSPAGITLANTSLGLENQRGNYNPDLVSWTGSNICRPQFSYYLLSSFPKLVADNLKHVKGRPGGGWEDDDVQETVNSVKPLENTSKGTAVNSVSNSKTWSFLPMTENLLKAHEYENKLINDTIQLGGVRLKQADKVLEDFAKAARNLSVPVVASILIHKIRSEDLLFINRARLIYDIEILIKRIDSYFSFFQSNIETLKKLRSEIKESNPSNLLQLKRILDDVIKQLETPQSPQSTTISATSKTSTNTGNLLDVENCDDAFDFIKPVQEISPNSQTRNRKASAFGFINQNEGFLDKRDDKYNKTPTYHGPTSFNTDSFAKVMEDYSMSNPQAHTKEMNQGKATGIEDLNSIDFSGFNGALNHQQNSPGNRLDILWNYDNYTEGAIDCTRDLQIEAEKKRKQEQEIEDKFFGFVKINTTHM